MTAERESLLKAVLEKIATEQKYDDPIFEITVVPNTGGNFTSQLFQAAIKGENKENLNLFAKVSVLGEDFRKENGCEPNYYHMEPFFYTEVVNKFREIEEKYKVPEKNRLNVSKCYGFSNEYLKEVLVLEDWSKVGFVTYDRKKSVDWDYAAKSIEELAKFHALSFAYQQKYPEHYEEAMKIFKRPMIENSDVMQRMLYKSIPTTTEMVRAENRDKYQNFFGSIHSEAMKKYYSPHKRPVIIHSDYRPSNLLHKTCKDGSLKVIIVDYQTLHSGSVVTDLLYFIFTSSDGQFRAQYYDKLVQHYYENLAASLKRVGRDPEQTFSRADFDEELKEWLPFGLLVSSLFLPFLTMDLEDFTTNDEGVYESDSLKTVTDMYGKANKICERRLNEVVDDYVKWGVL